MLIYENGLREATSEELTEIAEQERQYWQTILYDDAVDAEIRKRYTASQEFAILRQKDEKPEEYAAYYAYCEECKAYVRDKVAEVNKLVY